MPSSVYGWMWGAADVVMLFVRHMANVITAAGLVAL
jgi:hypothetical protein